MERKQYLGLLVISLEILEIFFYGKKLVSGYGDRVKGKKIKSQERMGKKTKIESMKKMENQRNLGRETRQWK